MLHIWAVCVCVCNTYCVFVVQNWMNECKRKIYILTVRLSNIFYEYQMGKNANIILDKRDSFVVFLRCIFCCHSSSSSSNTVFRIQCLIFDIYIYISIRVPTFFIFSSVILWEKQHEDEKEKTSFAPHSEVLRSFNLAKDWVS